MPPLWPLLTPWRELTPLGEETAVMVIAPRCYEGEDNCIHIAPHRRLGGPCDRHGCGMADRPRNEVLLRPDEIKRLRYDHFAALRDREPSRVIRRGWQVWEGPEKGARFLTDKEIELITEVSGGYDLG